MGKRNRAERHKGRRRRFTPERPLELSGAVDLAEPVPPRWARVGRALEAVVSALPTYRSGTREGRQKVLALRSVVAVAALMLASFVACFFY